MQIKGDKNKNKKNFEIKPTFHKTITLLFLKTKDYFLI